MRSSSPWQPQHWQGRTLHGAKGEQNGPASPSCCLARGTSGDTKGCTSPLAPSHLGMLSPQSVLVEQDALAKAGRF